MLLNLQWSYSDLNFQQKFQWDKLIVSEDEAKNDFERSYPFLG